MPTCVKKYDDDGDNDGDVDGVFLGCGGGLFALTPDPPPALVAHVECYGISY